MAGKETFTAPLIDKNPVTLHVLGICSALAITNSLTSSLIMSVALTTVLILSNMAISLVRKHLPSSVRLIVQITIIASAVTVIDQFLRAYMPDAARTLSVYISLIVTNCIVLGRAEAFACKNGIMPSIYDGLIMGLGFALFSSPNTTLIMNSVPKERYGMASSLTAIMRNLGMLVIIPLVEKSITLY